MEKYKGIILGLLLAIIGGMLFYFYGLIFLFFYAGFLVVLELASFLLIKRLRKESPLFITADDEKPILDKNGLDKFFKQGYDAELGWIRKPKTMKEEQGKFGKTAYHINEKGARMNPGHEHLPVKISCYGDSFAFSRQVDDDETWEWYLSKITESNVLNFGVGNYGIDQALLRLKREFSLNKSKIVMIGVVPSTIVRILGIWKHYHDYGNTFGFKPFFTVEDGKLAEHENFVNNQNKFSSYQQYLPQIQTSDYFYKHKFKKEMIEFPYFLSIISNPLRNIPLIGIFSWRMLQKKGSNEEKGERKSSLFNFLTMAQLYFLTPTKVKLYKKNKYAADLLTKIVEEFKNFGEKRGFEPILLWMPQKDDVLFMKRRGVYYQKWMEAISQKIKIIDLTSEFMKYTDLGALYSDDNTDGGHLSPQGNQKTAEIIERKMREWGCL